MDHGWIKETQGSHELFVGLDPEWRWDYQVASIQLCDVRRRCLIFQLSQSLISFVGDQNISFVGKAVQEFGSSGILMWPQGTRDFGNGLPQQGHEQE